MLVANRDYTILTARFRQISPNLMHQIDGAQVWATWCRFVSCSAQRTIVPPAGHRRRRCGCWRVISCGKKKIAQNARPVMWCRRQHQHTMNARGRPVMISSGPLQTCWCEVQVGPRHCQATAGRNPLLCVRASPVAVAALFTKPSPGGSWALPGFARLDCDAGTFCPRQATISEDFPSPFVVTMVL